MMLGIAAWLIAGAVLGQTSDAPSIIGPTWVVVELAGTPVPLTPAERQPSLEFVAGGRVGGTDGCNRLRATYTLAGERLSFGPVAMTRMACPGLEPPTARFEAVLKGTVRWRLVSGRLQFFDKGDVLLAAFEARRAGATAGEEPAPAPLKSRVFDWSALTPTPIPNGERRMILDGRTATVDLLHVHATTLAVGQASGEALRHPRDEVLIVKDGEVEVSLDGATQKAGAGAVLFFASGAVTRLKNIGSGPATYYVIYYETPKTPKQ